MKLKFLGTEIYVSFLFVAVIALLLAIDKTGLALPTLFAVTMHELGHLFAMWLFESGPKSIRLIPASVQITRNISTQYKNDIIIAIMGPIVNVVLFFTLYINYLTFKNSTVLSYALINLIVGVFNLIPVTGLDGGTALFSIIAKRGDVNKAMLTLKIITLSIASAVLFLAVSLTIRGQLNVSVYIVAIYIFISALIKI
ncbi:MAG: M50 family metallopeptidase [Clostridia bacterium]|nr:M50 family metallopeptidase [Clostridia bacterium]